MILSWCPGTKCDPCALNFYCTVKSPYAYDFVSYTDKPNNSMFSPVKVLDTYGNYLVTLTTSIISWLGPHNVQTLYYYSTLPNGQGQLEGFGAPGYNEPPYIYGPYTYVTYNGEALLQVVSSFGPNIPLHAPDPLGQNDSIMPICSSKSNPTPPGQVSAIPSSIPQLGNALVWPAPSNLTQAQLIAYAQGLPLPPA